MAANVKTLIFVASGVCVWFSFLPFTNTLHFWLAAIWLILVTILFEITIPTKRED